MTNQTSEYVLAEVVAGQARVLPGCGSWYSDRYYTDNLTGDLAVWEALDRVQASVPAEYTVMRVRVFERGGADDHSAGRYVPVTRPAPAHPAEGRSFNEGVIARGVREGECPKCHLINGHAVWCMSPDAR
jgi:hypothetical protein